MILFCLWHMTAIGLYTLPASSGFSFVQRLQAKQTYTQPYLFLLSQWQNWDIFSPDPLRRVTDLKIEKMKNGAWIPVRIFDSKQPTGFRRAPEMKYLSAIESTVTQLQEPFIQDVCRVDRIKRGTPMRLSTRVFVVPKPNDLGSIAKWRAWQPEWSGWSEYKTVCNTLNS